jgi:endogenous inhibitor of DNA gyrase (YacG/DUF329 family)
MSATERVCPICARRVAPRAENPASPFCSPACKLVDLGRWLDGDYRLPHVGSGEPGDDIEDEKHETARGGSYDAD